MGLLDQLFKHSSPAEGESQRASRDPAIDPGGMPRVLVGAAQRLEVSRCANTHATVGAAAEVTSPDDELVIKLGDILAHVPTHLLRMGMHDEERQLRLRVADVSLDGAGLRATVPSSDLVRACPDVFIAAEPAVAISLSSAVVLDQLRAKKAATGRVEELQQSREALQIELGLAAVLRHCPPELFTQEMPEVDPQQRISFPFASINEQLPSGKVVVSSSAFACALPPACARIFRAVEGVGVPLPVQEVLDNLPSAAFGAANRSESSSVLGVGSGNEPLTGVVPRATSDGSEFQPTQTLAHEAPAEKTLTPSEVPSSAGEPSPAGSSSTPTGAESAQDIVTPADVPDGSRPPAVLPPPITPTPEAEITPTPELRTQIPETPAPPENGDPVARGESILSQLQARPALTQPPNLLAPGSVAKPVASHPLAERASELAALPGATGCLIVSGAEAEFAGDLPPDLTLPRLRALCTGIADAIRAAAPDSPDRTEHVMVNRQPAPLSIFVQGSVCICAVLRSRTFLPGVIESFNAAARELADTPSVTRP